jgi:hypothetical protein
MEEKAVSDTGIQITPEDRERLAKTKFGEWFDEFFEKKFEEAFEKRTKTHRPTPASAEVSSGGGQGEQHQKPATPQRKRSLLEACLTDTFGF